MLLIYLFLCSISLASARADLKEDDFCFVACQQILHGVRFNGTNPKTGDPWSPCGNELEYASLYLCNKLFCADEERERGVEGVNEGCRRFSNATVPPYSIIAGFTEEGIEKLHHLEVGELSRMAPRTYNEVLVPSEKLYGLAWGTLVSIHLSCVYLANFVLRMLHFSREEFMSHMVLLCIIFGLQSLPSDYLLAYYDSLLIL